MKLYDGLDFIQSLILWFHSNFADLFPKCATCERLENRINSIWLTKAYSLCIKVLMLPLDQEPHSWSLEVFGFFFLIAIN